MNALMHKMAAIEATGILGIDLSWLNANYQRAMFHYVRKCTADRLRELAGPRRLATLTCFLRQSYRDTIDQAVDMFDKIIIRMQADTARELDEQMCQQRKTIKVALSSLRALGEIILDDDIDDVALRPKLFAAVPRDKLQEQVAGLHEWVSGKRSDAFHGIVRRFSYFRQFSPTMLSALEFFPDAEQTSSPCMEAIQVLRKMNTEQHGHKKVMLPDDAPVDFIPKRLAPIVMNGGLPSRPAWECALMLKLQEELKSGNISVGNSKRFGRFDDYFLPQEQWAFRRETFFQRSGLPSDPKEVAGYLKARLNRAYDLFLQTAPGNSYASVDEDGWCLSVDTPEKPGKEADEKLDRLKSWLGRHMRTTRLTDMLIEVDNDIRFTDHFLPPAQKGKRDRKEIHHSRGCAWPWCNLGLGTMADLIQGISYKELRRVSDWQMTQEAQRAALAAVVHAISRLDTTIYWGEGRTSASDGQRFALPRRVSTAMRLSCLTAFSTTKATWRSRNIIRIRMATRN